MNKYKTIRQIGWSLGMKTVAVEMIIAHLGILSDPSNYRIEIAKHKNGNNFNKYYYSQSVENKIANFFTTATDDDMRALFRTPSSQSRCDHQSIKRIKSSEKTINADTSDILLRLPSNLQRKHLPILFSYITGSNKSMRFVDRITTKNGFPKPSRLNGGWNTWYKLEVLVWASHNLIAKTSEIYNEIENLIIELASRD